MKSARVLSLALALAAGSATSAETWTWLANPVSALWLGDANWNLGVWDEASTANTVALPASATRDIDLNGSVRVATVKTTANAGDYSITGGSLTVDRIDVDKGSTLTLDTEVRQQSATETDRLAVAAYDNARLTFKGAEGRVNEISQFAANGGAVHFDGGETHISRATTAGDWNKVPYLQAGGDTYVEGGARITLTGASTYLSIIAGDLVVTNGVFDAWNVAHYRNGWGNDNNGLKSSRARTIVKDNGTLIAQKYLIGKGRPTESWYNPETYAKTILGAGGTLVVTGFEADGNGSIDFDGGTLVITNGLEKGNAQLWVTGQTGAWTNQTLNVCAGGVRVYQPRGNQYSTLCTPFVSNGGPDGGMRVAGNGFFYMQADNTYTGGTHVVGPITYIPNATNALGATTSEPRDTLFIDAAKSAPVIHFGMNMTLPATHDVSIATNMTFSVGAHNDFVGRIAGVIHGPGADGHESLLNVVSSWPGCVAIGPEGGRTNLIGRIVVKGHLRHVAGTTLVTSNAAGKVGEAAPLHLCGTNKGYDSTKGVLEVTGGTLAVTKKAWIDLSGYSQLIVSNGTFDASKTAEFLNGLGTPARTVVGDGGRLVTGQLRLTQCSARTADGTPVTEIQLNKGGLLSAVNFWMDLKGFTSRHCGVLRLNGGTLQARATTQNFFGESNTDYQRALWTTNAWVLAEAGGAVIDTQSYTIRFYSPIRSGAERDGGVTKRGSGVLTLAGTNTYNGVTRVEDGQLVFSHEDGFPGGDVEISAAALKERRGSNTPFLRMVDFALETGKTIRITEAETLGDDAWRRYKPVLVTATNPIASVPQLILVNSDGTEKPADGDWRLRLSDDGKSLNFGPVRGMMIIMR